MKLKMNPSDFMRILIAAFLLALFSTNTVAHTALQESNPGDGATVKTPPAQLDLVFNGPVKLIKLELSKTSSDIKGFLVLIQYLDLTMMIGW